MCYAVSMRFKDYGKGLFPSPLVWNYLPFLSFKPCFLIFAVPQELSCSTIARNFARAIQLDKDMKHNFNFITQENLVLVGLSSLESPKG